MEAWISQVQKSIDDIKEDLLKIIEAVEKLKMGEQHLKYIIDRNKKLNEEMVERTRRGRGKPT